MTELTVADLERVRDLADTLADVVIALNHSHDEHRHSHAEMRVRLDAMAVALVALADATGHEINVDLGLGDVTDVMKRHAEEKNP